MAGGQKWMPKRLGRKVRHRDLKSNNKEQKNFKKFNYKNGLKKHNFKNKKIKN